MHFSKQRFLCGLEMLALALRREGRGTPASVHILFGETEAVLAQSASASIVSLFSVC